MDVGEGRYLRFGTPREPLDVREREGGKSA
jgi:hypothetical protein